ncbi:MAG: type II secretion system minor pseudopilin GspH [Dokdonella sp.]
MRGRALSSRQAQSAEADFVPLTPTLSPNTNTLGARGQNGFTLIELLVVVVIIGVLAAALVISIGGSTERELSNASDRFQALVGHACNQAELSGREIGISIAADGYTFSRLDRDEWRAFGQDGELRARSWPRGLHVELTRAGRPLQLSIPGRESPQLVCFSSGELTPFDVTLALGDAAARYRIEGADDGVVKIKRIEATP